MWFSNIFNFFKSFIFGCALSLLLCMGFSSRWLLLLQSTGFRDKGSIAVAQGLSCLTACGIFLDQGSNPCPLQWQVDSYPLYHQESPPITLLTEWLIHERGEVLTEAPSYPVALLFDPAQNCKKMFISSSALPGVLWVMSKKLWATFGIWKILKISLSHEFYFFFFH